jgi:hypothetical protein
MSETARTVDACGYCTSRRDQCTCETDCGARPREFTGAWCTRATGYLDWLRRRGTYSDAELATLADRGFR